MDWAWVAHEYMCMVVITYYVRYSSDVTLRLGASNLLTLSNNLLELV